MAVALLDLEGPVGEAIEGLAALVPELGGAQCGAGAVDEQHAQVGVATLGHATQASGIAAGMLARGDAEPGKVELVGPQWKALDVADSLALSAVAVIRSTPAQPAGALAAQVAGGELGELGLDGGDRALAAADLIQDGGHGVAQGHGKFVVGILEGGEHGGPDLDLPRAKTMPNSRSRPRSRLIEAVRADLQCSRTRRRAWMPCWSALLTGTDDRPGQRSASSRPAVLVRSVLLRRT